MRIAVIGSGAIGTLVSGYLNEKGVGISFTFDEDEQEDSSLWSVNVAVSFNTTINCQLLSSYV